MIASSLCALLTTCLDTNSSSTYSRPQKNHHISNHIKNQSHNYKNNFFFLKLLVSQQQKINNLIIFYLHVGLFHYLCDWSLKLLNFFMKIFGTPKKSSKIISI